jgi:hypothetical protein
MFCACRTPTRCRGDNQNQTRGKNHLTGDRTEQEIGALHRFQYTAISIQIHRLLIILVAKVRRIFIVITGIINSSQLQRIH